MSKGEITRQQILDHAVAIASRVGLGGMTIGRLADDLNLSKSGLYAHFQSKEALQLKVLEAGADKFVNTVVRPSLRSPRGEPRLKALFENWLRWPDESSLQGGCLFVQVAAEFDDLAGPVRDKLVQLQKDWFDVIVNAARTAVSEGHFRADTDVELFAFEFYGVMLMFHHAERLLRDPNAEPRARTAFESLLKSRYPTAQAQSQ
jgi:AcrR family transcriptional regulator